ncbi:DUF4394 domain-containing protein [Conexibacter sp. SYSU D00693]|uniref:DUF4394 domain-containing protein n=1 Tax=Conexibacter sp. SYSU D00693 TaxID=2812560 RepID=UPI00196A41EF|nr:DUF4394 domain-containing protein [Conexibacter sp. SYSU D00693]
MSRSRRTALATLAGAAAVLGAPAAASAAEALYGVTDQNRLVQFASDAPGDVRSSVPIRGLAQGEVVVSIDVRPATDQLYAITNLSRIHYVNPTTGATRLVGAGPITPNLNGTTVGADFNPVADALRLTTDTEQNLRVRFSDQASFEDTALSYAAGDPGAGTNPVVGGVAYTSSVPGATTTTLLGIDSARDALVRIDPPNSGTLTTVGALNVDAGPITGFDIAATGDVAFAAFQTAGSGAVNLHRIDLSTGRATPAAASPAILLPAGQGLVRSIAAAGQVADDDTRPEASVAFSSTILEENTDTLEPSVSCDETCGVSIRATVDGSSAGTGTATIVGAGRETVDIRLSSAARSRIARRGTELIRLAVTVTDAAGNRSTQERTSRTQTLSDRRG